MKIFLDEMPLAESAGSIDEAVRAAARSAELVGRVIVEVNADGRTLNSAELSAVEVAGAGVKELRVVSADPHALVSGVFRDAAGALDEIKAAQLAAADSCATGRGEGVHDQLRGVIDSWSRVQRALHEGAAMVGLRLGAVTVAGPDGAISADGLVRSLAESLGRVRRAVESQDTAALGDELGYDLADLADRWRDLFLALERQVVRKAA